MNERQANKRKHAVALRYAEDDQAPKVIATGAGELAKRILTIAQEYGIQVHREDSLADILSKVELGHEIPPETYLVVAQILAFLIQTDVAWGKRKKEEGSPLAVFCPGK